MAVDRAVREADVEADDAVEAAQLVGLAALSSVKVGASTSLYPRPKPACLIVSGAYNRSRQGGARKERNPMAHFPDTPTFTGFNTPSRVEADVHDLPHEGTIPPELDGAFYRVQPDPQFPPQARRRHRLQRRRDDQPVPFPRRPVRLPPALGADRQVEGSSARRARALFGAYRNPLTDDDSVKGMIRSTANTTAFLYRRQAVGDEGGQPERW